MKADRNCFFALFLLSFPSKPNLIFGHETRDGSNLMWFPFVVADVELPLFMLRLLWVIHWNIKEARHAGLIGKKLGGKEAFMANHNSIILSDRRSDRPYFLLNWKLVRWITWIWNCLRNLLEARPTVQWQFEKLQNAFLPHGDNICQTENMGQRSPARGASPKVERVLYRKIRSLGFRTRNWMIKAVRVSRQTRKTAMT